MQTLEELKAIFTAVSGTQWSPSLVDSVAPPKGSQAAAQATTSSGAPAAGLSESDTTLLLIRDIGDRIRQMKSDKADKASNYLIAHLINLLITFFRNFQSKIDAAVAELKEAKTKFKALTGKEWAPDPVEKIKAAPAVQAQAMPPQSHLDSM